MLPIAPQLQTWIIAALVGTLALIGVYHLGAYHGRADGRLEVQSKWDKDIAQRAENARQATEEARERESHQAAAARKAIDEANQLAARDRAAAIAARAQLERVQRAAREAAGSREAGSAQPAQQGGDGAAVTAVVFGECAAELVRLGEAADGLRNQVIELQLWVVSALEATGSAPSSDEPTHE